MYKVICKFWKLTPPPRISFWIICYKNTQFWIWRWIRDWAVHGWQEHHRPAQWNPTKSNSSMLCIPSMSWHSFPLPRRIICYIIICYKKHNFEFEVGLGTGRSMDGTRISPHSAGTPPAPIHPCNTSPRCGLGEVPVLCGEVLVPFMDCS